MNHRRMLWWHVAVPDAPAEEQPPPPPSYSRVHRAKATAGDAQPSVTPGPTGQPWQGVPLPRDRTPGRHFPDLEASRRAKSPKHRRSKRPPARQVIWNVSGWGEEDGTEARAPNKFDSAWWRRNQLPEEDVVDWSEHVQQINSGDHSKKEIDLTEV